MTHSDLVKAGYQWLKSRCGVVIKDLRTINQETPDVIGFSQGVSFLIECKLSRADFLKDKKKPFRIISDMGMGRFRFYLCPKDLIKVEELPHLWGLIYVNDKGKAKCVHNPYGKGNIFQSWHGLARNEQAEMNVMYSALRRLFKQGLIEKIY